GDFQPKLSEASRNADALFLANIQPDLQRQVREQCTGTRLAGLDSMNLWIETQKEALVRTIGGVDLIFMNDADRRAMTYGSVLASFNVEEFGTERVQRLTRDEIDARFEEFRQMTALESARV